jgi:diguanylate cyclase (GGDEF)-like protein
MSGPAPWNVRDIPLTRISQPTNQQDLRILRRLHAAQSVCLGAVGLIAAAVLCGWLVPAARTLLPEGWAVMKANTALAFLLCTASVLLTQTKRSPRRTIEARICAFIVMVIAGAALFAYSTGHAIGLEIILVEDSGAPMPGRMSVQSAVYLEIAGMILALEGIGREAWIHIVDGLTMAFVLLILTVIAGYVFDAADLFGQAPYTRVSPQTLACMVLLGFAVVGTRTRRGFFSALVGDAIGSQTARVTLPVAVMMPFLIVSASAYATRSHFMTTPYAAALAASTCSVLVLAFVVIMARRVNRLERALRDMSLVDELTKIYNRRAFYLFGEHALREARRSDGSLMVLFFDLNGLKSVNDTLGHQAGSRLLLDAANLLRASFRSIDVVARVGGDEFAVVTREHRDLLMAALTRLDSATAAANRSSGNAYRISFSMGEASIEPGSVETFAELVERADAMMYERKRRRRSQGDAAPAAANPGASNPGAAAPDSMATGVVAAYVAQKVSR